MNLRQNSAEEGLLSWVERWTPADSELWSAWRRTLTPEQRAESLLPLQAALSGLVAFRYLENHPPASPGSDFRAHLHAVGRTYAWALRLVARLQSERPPERRLQSVAQPIGEPLSSLRALERSLTDALRVTERLLGLPLVDAVAFQASFDLFLRDLSRNAFFRPPDPLEFSNVSELLGPESFGAELQSWRSDASKMTTAVGFLALLRDHHFLGIADSEIREAGGLYRAHVLIAAVRRELRTLTRFLLVQGVETFADELEARLLSLDAHHITGARTEITRASHELCDLRDAVEGLAMGIHAKARSTLSDPLPELDSERGYALPGERMRNGIRELRATLHDAAKQLNQLARPASLGHEERPSERVQRNLRQDIWAFRFILWGFVAKASVASLDANRWGEPGKLEFAVEFVRHFRVFGPGLARSTDYDRRGVLTRAVSALSKRDAIDAQKLELATRECTLFAEHLDRAHEEIPQSLLAPFDKEKAASELRGYLAAARDRGTSDRAAAAAFGLIDPHRAQAS